MFRWLHLPVSYLQISNRMKGSYSIADLLGSRLEDRQSFCLRSYKSIFTLININHTLSDNPYYKVNLFFFLFQRWQTSRLPNLIEGSYSRPWTSVTSIMSICMVDALKSLMVGDWEERKKREITGKGGERGRATCSLTHRKKHSHKRLLYADLLWEGCTSPVEWAHLRTWSQLGPTTYLFSARDVSKSS